MDGSYWLLVGICAVLTVVAYVALVAVGVVVSLGATLMQVNQSLGAGEQDAQASPRPSVNRRMRRAQLRAVK